MGPLRKIWERMQMMAKVESMSIEDVTSWVRTCVGAYTTLASVFIIFFIYLHEYESDPGDIALKILDISLLCLLALSHFYVGTQQPMPSLISVTALCLCILFYCIILCIEIIIIVMENDLLENHHFVFLVVSILGLVMGSMSLYIVYELRGKVIAAAAIYESSYESSANDRSAI
jgi:hypothetical protein